MSSDDDMPDLVGCDSTGSSSSDDSDSDVDVPTSTPFIPPTSSFPHVVEDDDDDLPELLSDSDSSSASSDDSSDSDPQSVPPVMVSNDSDSGGESLPELVSDCSSSDDSDNEDKYTKKAAKKAKAKAKADKGKRKARAAKKAKAAKAAKAKAKAKGVNSKRSKNSKNNNNGGGRKRKKKLTPEEKFKQDEKDIKDLEAKLNQLEMRSHKLNETNQNMASDNAALTSQNTLVQDISKSTQADDNLIIDQSVKELQFLYNKHDCLQILNAHMKHRLFKYDIDVNRVEDIENDEIKKELDQNFKRAGGNKNKKLNKKQKEKQKKLKQQQKQLQKQIASHKIVGRRNIINDRAELPDMCMLCTEELYAPGMHPLKRLDTLMKEFQQWTVPEEEEERKKNNGGGKKNLKKKDVKSKEQLIGPKTPEAVVAAGHAGGFSLFCDCCNLVHDCEKKRTKGKKKNKKNKDQKDKEDNSGDLVGSREEMERLEAISQKWATYSVDERKKWQERVKNAEIIVSAKKKSGIVKGIATISSCGHAFHVTCLGSYFNSSVSLTICDKVEKVMERASCPLCSMKTWTATKEHSSELKEDYEWKPQPANFTNKRTTSVEEEINDTKVQERSDANGNVLNRKFQNIEVYYLK